MMTGGELKEVWEEEGVIVGYSCILVLPKLLPFCSVMHPLL